MDTTNRVHEEMVESQTRNKETQEDLDEKEENLATLKLKVSF